MRTKSFSMKNLVNNFICIKNTLRNKFGYKYEYLLDKQATWIFCTAQISQSFTQTRIVDWFCSCIKPICEPPRMDSSRSRQHLYTESGNFWSHLSCCQAAVCQTSSSPHRSLPCSFSSIQATIEHLMLILENCNHNYLAHQIHILHDAMYKALQIWNENES